MIAHPRIACLLLSVFALSGLSLAVRAQDSSHAPENVPGSESEEKPIVLSPLDVEASTSVGYGAGATASTSRLVQNYVDVPQTVNVVTTEFLTDYNLIDVRQALEYVSNMQFGLTDNPYSTRIRGAIVTSTYIDGVSMPGQYSAEPMDFFDRAEVVKGPSSAAFGLGQPGGLINFVSKTPSRIDSTTASFSVGGYNNYIARFDSQGIAPNNDKLSYRAVGFWDTGDYATPNTSHNGAGAQLSLRYDWDRDTRLDLIVAYSQTNYPASGIQNSIWMNKTIYQTWQVTNLGSSVYEYLPGTVFSNGSVFGVSGTLPPPGTQVGLLGTGKLVGADSNANPPGPNGDQENTLRTTLVFTKDFADDHLHLRNALTLAFNQADIFNETPDAVLAIPGSANTLPSATVGYGEPGGVNGAVGAPFFGIGYSRVHTTGNSTARDDELDLLATDDILGMKWTTLIGGDIYDNEGSAFGYQLPDVNANGTAAYENIYSNNNPPLFTPSNYTINAYSNSHSWGDGFYAQEDVNAFNGLIDALAGWRIDYFDTETRNYATGQRVFPGWVNTKGAPRFALTVKPLKWLSFYELYTKHADPTQSTNKYFLASGTEWTPALQAQFPEGQLEFFQPGGYTVESGAKASFLNGKIYASVAVFHELTTGQLNPIVAANVVNPDGTDTQIGVNQVQGLNAHGIEVEVFGQATPRLNFTANYGILRGYYPAFSNGLPDWLNPSATATMHGKLDLGDLHGNGFYVTFGGEWFGPYWIWQSANGYEYYNSSQYLVDGGIGFRWRTGKYRHSLYFNMDNVTNNVVSIGTVTPWTIEPLRSYYLTYKISY